MALLLGVAGIYGVISYAVSQRTREIGIRIALGARAAGGDPHVRRARAAAGGRRRDDRAGARPGLMRLISTLLFEVRPIDPLTYALVALTLIGATVLASYVPALRATAVDPIDALRAE